MQISVTVYSLVFGHKIAGKIYISISKIDNITTYRRNSFKIQWILIYLIAIIHLIYRVIYDYLNSVIIFTFVLYICQIPSDLEIIYFSMIVDVVLRRVEMLNDNLIHINKIRKSSKTVDFHIQSNMTSSVWSIHEHNYIRLENIEILVAVFNKLCVVIDNINNCFGITVST